MSSEKALKVEPTGSNKNGLNLTRGLIPTAPHCADCACGQGLTEPGASRKHHPGQGLQGPQRWMGWLCFQMPSPFLTQHHPFQTSFPEWCSGSRFSPSPSWLLEGPLSISHLTRSFDQLLRTASASHGHSCLCSRSPELFPWHGLWLPVRPLAPWTSPTLHTFFTSFVSLMTSHRRGLRQA